LKKRQLDRFHPDRVKRQMEKAQKNITLTSRSSDSQRVGPQDEKGELEDLKKD